MPERHRAGMTLAVVLLFAMAIGAALAIAPTYAAQGVQVLHDPGAVWGPPAYLVSVVLLSMIVLALARAGHAWLIQGIFLAAIFATLLVVLEPLLQAVTQDDPASVASTVLAAGLTTFLLLHPEWYVLDLAGVVVAAGSAAVLGISFTPPMALFLLVLFSLYDAISVHWSGHMVELSRHIRDLRLPILLAIPPRLSHRLGTEPGAGSQDDGDDRPLFLGLGDIILPGLLAVSAAEFLPPASTGLAGFPLSGPLSVALTTMVATIAAFIVLLARLEEGGSRAGLLILNTGAITGFLVSAWSLYGIGVLLP